MAFTQHAVSSLYKDDIFYFEIPEIEATDLTFQVGKDLKGYFCFRYLLIFILLHWCISWLKSSRPAYAVARLGP